MSNASARLRSHPQQRFAPDEQLFDLNEAARKLRQEPSGQHGHKQIALFKHGKATLALYSFEADSRLADHLVDGPVNIHVLEGKLVVHTPSDTHTVNAGQLLRLAPGVKHDVEAAQRSLMLLTVCVEGPNSHS